MATQVQDYNALLEAIANYYGTGSDQWVEIAKYGMAGEDAYNILRQTPGVNVTVSKSGQVLGYTVDKLTGINSQTPTSIINSNNQVSVMSNPTSLSYPADMTISQSTGKVVAESGMKSIRTGSKVASTVGKVAVSVGAVASGIQAGAVVAGAVYNTFPDFFDSIGMSSFNPQTWDSICTTQEGKDLFNMVFGINKDTGTTQAYMDETAYAYVVAYLASQGVFDTGGKSADITDTTGLSPEVIAAKPFSFSESCVFDQGSSGGYISGVGPTTAPPTEVATDIVANDPIYYFVTGVTDNNVEIFACSKSQFSFTKNTHNLYGVYTSQIRGSRATINNQSVYVSSVHSTTVNSITILSDMTKIPSSLYGYYTQIAYVICYGTHAGGGGVEGITKQDDATYPTGITAEMTIPEVLALLKNQYPDLFTNGIYNDVVQPDGTVKRFNYVPVGIPDGFNYDQTTGQLKPTGGDLTKQGDTTITDDSTDDLLQQLIDLMTHPDPSNPEKTEDTNQYPDTGEGITPSIVVPVGSASALYSIYNPTQAELNSFGGWLWSSNFVDQLLKLFNDPMQAIIGLHKVFATPEISGTGTIKVGYLDSGVSSKIVESQYVTVNCGEVSLYEFFGNVFDYAPFTKVYIYLPFIGIMQIDTGEVMRGTIGVVYHADVLTGACLAEVKVTRDNAGGTLYVYTGNCACQYPISSGSYMGIVASLASVVGGIIGTVASGGALAPVAMGSVSGILNAHTDISHSGGFSGNAGAMGIKKPYLIIRRPQTALAENFQHFNGKPANHYTLLSSCTGFVKCLDCHLEGIPATGEELAELDSLLKSGIII